MKNCILVIPAFEPRKNLGEYVDELLKLHIGPVVIVDDGSGQKYRSTFRRLNSKDNCYVLYHDDNYGKGAAIKTATQWCLDHFYRFEGIISLDCDGRYRPEDVEAIYNQLCAKDSHRVILGSRSFSRKDNTPALTKGINSICSKVMKLIYSIDLKDTQTGLRAYPYELLSWLIDVEGDRYEYELNVLIEAKKRGYAFDKVKVDCLFVRDNADSHFRPFKDSFMLMVILIKGLMKYFASSLTATLVDIILFTLLSSFFFSHMMLGTRILLATIIARVFSSLLNYTINRKLVFQPDVAQSRTMKRFYTMWICQVSVSYLLVFLFSWLSGWNSTLIKLIVDFFLALVVYQVQLRWVFKVPGYKTASRLPEDYKD